MMIHSIIENLQREDLNPIEEAKLIILIDKESYTHAEIADKMGNHVPILPVLFDC